MTTPSLPEKVLAIDRSLADVPHAFGGALALAYYAEPRTTIDIDLNVFVPPDQSASVLEPLARLGVDTSRAATSVQQDGQVRVLWDETPLDLFFSYDAFHRAAAAAVAAVPFADATIPILSADHLVVCKVVFDRPKDWVDIQAMRELEAPLDAAEILRWVGRLVGDADPRYDRIAALITT